MANRVNEAYQRYIEAPEQTKSEAEAELIFRLKRYARTVCWVSIGEYVDGFDFDMAGEIMTSLDQYRGDGRFSAWCYSIMQRNAWKELTDITRQKWEIHPEPIDDGPIDDGDDIAMKEIFPGVPPDQETQVVIGEIVDGFSPEDRVIWDAICYEPPEIVVAAQLGVSVDAVGSRKWRFRKSLKEKLLWS